MTVICGLFDNGRFANMSTAMDGMQLNLARKWRARSFDQMIGQELSVKMLKNSLYRGHFFPVYLLWGQRGTGKTSMARLFAAAINCAQLSAFQQEPKNNCVPCGACSSCIAMLEGKHPDFIEIDAASNTGVDNVRHIIESAAFLPILGKKKIYLIDEAHMLSKAAFNALLKILEEPPVSALFMLATTDQQKILETVRSRCFQICFKSVNTTLIVDHLQAICSRELIYADNDALVLIAQQSEGSVRDAINMLEQVRFAQGRITKNSVLALLGYIDDNSLVVLLEIVYRCDGATLVTFLHSLSLEQFNADFIWKRLVEIVRMMVWAHYGLALDATPDMVHSITRLAQKFSIARLTSMLQLLYSYERIFSKTAGKHMLLEMLLLKMCQGNYSNGEPSNNPVSQQSASMGSKKTSESEDEELQDSDVEQDSDDESDVDEQAKPMSESKVCVDPWNLFLSSIEKLDDPLLISIFKNGQFKSFDPATGKIDVHFAKQFVFFSEWLAGSTVNWGPLLEQVFGSSVVLNPIFTDSIVPAVTQPSVPATKQVAEPVKEEIPVRHAAYKNYQSGASKPWSKHSGSPARPVVDVSDVAAWPKATMILRSFPGVVRHYVHKEGA